MQKLGKYGFCCRTRLGVFVRVGTGNAEGALTSAQKARGYPLGERFGCDLAFIAEVTRKKDGVDAEKVRYPRQRVGKIPHLLFKKGGGIVLNLFDTGNRWFPDNAITGSSASWIRQSFEFTTPADTGSKLGNNNKKIVPYLRLRLFNATGTVWFDNVTLEEIK